MEILTVYVGQGELAIVRHREEAVIVDSRWPEQLAASIERQMRNFLWNRNVVGLVLTGFDNDHADPRGVDYILGQYKPDWIMYPKYFKDTDNARKVFSVIRKHERRQNGSGKLLRKISVRLDLDLRKFSNLSHYFSYELFSPHFKDMDNSNNCSIVLRLKGIGYSGFSYLITGDTENDRWDTITRLFRNRLASDVLSAPHHGSRNAAHKDMVRLVSPDTVLISAGVDNQYGHPHTEAVKLYERIARSVYQTNVRNGVSLTTERDAFGFFKSVYPEQYYDGLASLKF